MTEKPGKTLRDRAETMLHATRDDINSMTAVDIHALVHELQVHQMELEIQNEELRDAQMALSESRDRFSELFEFAPVGYVVLDVTGMILEANLTATTLLGIERQKLTRRQFTDFVTRDAQDAWYLHWQAVFSAEVQKTCELMMYKADGTSIIMRLESVPFGRPADRRCRTALIDNSALKHTEEKLRSLNENLEQRVIEKTSEVRLLAEALSHLAEGVIITDDDKDWPEPCIRYVNDALCRITGYTSDELIGKTPQILHGKESDPVFMEGLKREISAGRPFLGEMISYRKDGTAYNAELFITPLFDTSGHRTNFVSIHRDITERKRAERLLREQKQRLRSILNTASDAIVVITKYGLIDSVNPATEQLFGFSADEMLGQNVKMLIPAHYQDEHDRSLSRYLETGQAKIIGIGREVIGGRKDGSTFPLDLAVSAIPHLGLFTGIMRDITERKRLEKCVLEIAAEEQRRIGQDLHDGTQQELTGISLLAGLVRDLLRRARQERHSGKDVWLLEGQHFQQLSEIAVKVCQRLAEANQHVRQMAHGIMPVQIDSEGLRSALMRLVASTNDLQGITCRFDYPVSLAVENSTTATHLYRIAQEAVNNALRHGKADQIKISLEQENGRLCLDVNDNGVGFDPGSQLHKVKTGETQGMGMRIMAYRAEMIGGTLRVQPGPMGGMWIRCEILRGTVNS